MANYSVQPATFDEIKTYLINKITVKYPTIGAFVSNSFLVIFIDIVAYAIELFMDYSSNLLNELHLPTAINYENARIKAAFYGYNAHRKISAKGAIRAGASADFTLAPGNNVVIDKYDTFTVNGIKFVASEAAILTTSPVGTSNLYYVDIPVIQGEIVTINNTAKGLQNEQFTINASDVENTNFSVTVNGTEYTEVSSFFKSTSTSTHYILSNLENMTGVVITMGDGFLGKRLNLGDTVVIKYLKTLALDGQIKSVGFTVIFGKVYSPVLLGSNVDKIMNADDIDTLASIKYNGQLSTSSIEGKAFDDAEVKLALQNYGGILKSKAIGEFDKNPSAPDFTSANIVDLMVVTNSQEVLTAIEKTNIRNYLRPMMDFSDFINFIEIGFVRVRYSMKFKVFKNTPQNFPALVDQFLSTTYDLINFDFGQSLDGSEVVQAVSNYFDTYIKRFELTTTVVEEETASNFINYTSPHSITLLLGGLRGASPTLTACTVTAVYVKGGVSYRDTFISNGATFSVLSPEKFTTSWVTDTHSAFMSTATGDATPSINYVSGVVSYTPVAGITSVTSVEYDYSVYDKDGFTNNIDIKASQIIDFWDSNSEVEYLTV